jgi:hypothetical protein
MNVPPPKEVEWEVLPPTKEKKAADLEPLFRWLALIMDDFLRVPGTRFRFGLDPLIGLLPGLGDTGSAIVSALALIQAARRGVPKILLARMSLNILINEVIGIVPIVGDAFSFWFKSNVRNYQIIQEHMGAPRVSHWSDWVFVLGVLLLLFVVVGLGLVVSFLFLQLIARLLTGR